VDQSSAVSLQTPSVLAASAAPTGVGLLGALGLAPAQNAVSAALAGVGSVSNILADQLSQVAQLVNNAGATVNEVTGALGVPTSQLTAPVTAVTTNLTGGLSGTLRMIGSQSKKSAPSSAPSTP
jgi:hypothetical protein